VATQEQAEQLADSGCRTVITTQAMAALLTSAPSIKQRKAMVMVAKKNSGKFTKANGDRAARMAAIEAAKVQVTSKKGTLAAIEAEISDRIVQAKAKHRPRLVASSVAPIRSKRWPSCIRRFSACPATTLTD
jgi:hypothetical protein